MRRSAAGPARSVRSRFVARAGCLIALFTLACDGTEPRRAVALGVATQPPATAQSGVALTQAPVVEVRDQKGTPFAQAGVAVTASIAAGGGALGGTTTAQTDAEGRATFPGLVISGTVGPRTLRFSAEGLSPATSTSITLNPGPAATLEAASATTLQATVNAAVPTPPSVVVKDASGNGVPGVSVTFTIPGNGGTLTGATQSTNASGVATVGSWTLPTTAGQYALTAAAAGAPGTGVTFVATAEAGAPSAMQPSNGGQSALYGSRLPTPLQVRVVDQYGNPTRGVVVTWGSFSGLGTPEPINVATDADGIVRANYRLGTTPGENVIRASINPLGLSVDFTATALGFANQVAVGAFHTCALDERGAAYCWGQNDAGQLGDGTTTNRPAPTPVTGGLRFRTISTGFGVTCGLTADDVPYCWGSNAYGGLGDGTRTNRLVPTRVSGGHHFKELATGGQLTCALNAAGAAYCWGSNAFGGLGVGTRQVETCTSDVGNPNFPCSLVPVEVAGGLSFASITTSDSHACALNAARELYCWGFSSNFGGNAADGLDRAPVRAASGFTFAEVTAGGAHTCGVGASSQAYCWGNATQFGVIGNGTTEQTQETPAAVLSHLATVRMDAGGLGTCAVVTDGRAFCWGSNQTGAVGDGTTTNRHTPATVATGLSFTAIGTSGQHACGRIAIGQVHCWGYNVYGQLGVGDLATRLTPALVRP